MAEKKASLRIADNVDLVVDPVAIELRVVGKLFRGEPVRLGAD